MRIRARCANADRHSSTSVLNGCIAQVYAQPGTIALSTARAVSAFLVDQPVQKLCILRYTAVVALARADVGVQIVERFHVHGFEPSDFREVLDFFSSEPYVCSEAEHRSFNVNTVERTIFARFLSPCLYLFTLFLKRSPSTTPVTPQCDCAESSARLAYAARGNSATSSSALAGA